MPYPCVTKTWENYWKIVKLEDKMIECDARDQLPFYSNRFDCYAGDVLYLCSCSEFRKVFVSR